MKLRNILTPLTSTEESNMEANLTKVDKIIVRGTDAFLSLIDIGTVKMKVAF